MGGATITQSVWDPSPALPQGLRAAHGPDIKAPPKAPGSWPLPGKQPWHCPRVEFKRTGRRTKRVLRFALKKRQSLVMFPVDLIKTDLRV